MRGKLARWVLPRTVACLFLLGLVATFLALVILTQTIPSAVKCLPDEYTAFANSSGSQGIIAGTTPSKALEVVNVKDTQISLGRAMTPARTAITLKTDALPENVQTAASVGLRVQSFRRGDGGDVRQAVLAWGQFTSRQTIELYLCIERQSPGDAAHYAFTLDPGVYSGSVATADSRLPTTTIPFTVNMAYPDPYQPLMPLVGIVLVGTLYLMVLRRSDTDTDSAVGMLDLDAFLRRPSGLAAVAVGTGAAFAAYTAGYLASDTWGSGNDLYLLIGTMFTAFISAGTAFRFASNLDTSGHTGQRREQPPAEDQGGAQA